jgi:phosphoenolpyruvate synthase/pyruvate phosphate dikinase
MIYNLNEVSKKDINIVGGKARKLRRTNKKWF